MKTVKLQLRLLCVFLIVAGVCGGAGATAYVRKNKMFDVPQTERPEWGENWCVPTAVGNSFAWLAKEYGLNRLMKVNGTGDTLTAADVIDILGVVDMGTGPASGTSRVKVEQAKKDYIKRHGLEGRISVEAQVATPLQFLSDGSFAGFDGTKVTKKWLKEQYDKGQDVEFAVSYYEKIGAKWYRKGGHVAVYDGFVPGEYAGGHHLTLSGIFDPYGSDQDTDFQISFTDPGRDDLTGQYGAVNHAQYWLTDYAGFDWFNTESTYQVVYDSDPFGMGIDALLLDGYQGAGDYVADGSARTKLTVLEAGWAESPVPEPSLAIIMFGLLALMRKK